MSKGLLSSKKAQGMSLNTVIIAIIVLVVLVVLVMIFTGYFGKVFAPTVGSCAAGGGTCAPDCGKDQLNRPIGELKGYKCTGTEKCCQPNVNSAGFFN